MEPPKGTKPFSIEEWKNGGKPICRNGYEPTDLHYFESATRNVNPLVFSNDEGHLCLCDLKGVVSPGDFPSPDYDLFLKVEKKQAWINLYKFKNSKNVSVGALFFNEKEALDRNGYDGYLKTIKIEWDE